MIDWDKPICLENGKPLIVLLTFRDGVREVVRPGGGLLPCGWEYAKFYEDGRPYHGETYTIRNVREKKKPRKKKAIAT